MTDFFGDFLNSMRNKESKLETISKDDFDSLVKEAKIGLNIDLKAVMKIIYKCPDYYAIFERHIPYHSKIRLTDAYGEGYIVVELEYEKGSKKFKVPFDYFV